MPPLVTYRDAGDAQVTGQLFAGKRFFLVQRVPQRKRYVKDIEANGGVLVKLEAQADYLIADHLRTDSPAGSLSYTFIEKAIEDGNIPPESQHPARQPKGTPRPVGSAVPNKTSRTPFTSEDDMELWQWVKRAEAEGKGVSGNEIYKQLEAKNPRHTFQSWRARYMKTLANKPPVGLPTPPTSHVTPPVRLQRKTPVPRRALDPAPTPSEPPQSELTVPAHDNQNVEDALETLSLPDAQVEDALETLSQPDPEALPDTQVEPTTMPGFESEDLEDWLQGAETIQEIAVGRYHKAWVAMAEANPEHTAPEWRAYYERVILPIFLENEENNTPMQGAIGKNRYWEIIKAFGTQGQPIYTPSGRSDAVTAPREPDQSQPPAEPTPHETSRSNGKPKVEATPTAPKDSPSHTSAVVRHSPKRKLVNVPHAPEKAKKRLKVGETVSPDTRVQSRLYDPQSTDLPLASQDGHTSISSGPPSDNDDPPVFDADRTTPTSDVDALVQTQLLSEMKSQYTEKMALTAENLALAQAEHNPRRDRRAVDIVPDDEDKDQGAFAGYLETLVHSAAADGQMNKHSLEALRLQHQQLDTLVKARDQDGDGVDHGDQDDSDHHLDGDDVADNDSSIYIAPDGRRIDMKNIPNTVRTQDIDPNLDYSSPLRPQSPDYPAPLDPDHTPRQSPYKPQTQNGGLEYLEGEEDIDDIQLDLPEPPGGWDSPSSQVSAAHHPTTIDSIVESASRNKGKGRTRELYTQDIFNAKTQEPDFDIPDPVSQFDTLKHTPEPVKESQVMENEDIEVFAEQQVELGHEWDDVRTALIQTSMRSELCVYVLEEMRQGRGVPTNVAGIWPESDDQIIEGGDAIKIRQLHEKHGSAECNARLEFLKEWREQQEDSQL